MPIAINAPNPLTTPTYDGSGQVVHPSVIDSIEVTGEIWNGYRYWMGVTPYANSSAVLENPSILASHDLDTWVVPAGLTNPIVPKPAEPGRHLSDTDLLLEPDGSALHCFYRESGTGANIEEYIWVISSTDGVNWGVPVELFRTGSNTRKDLFLSCTCVKMGGTYHLYGVVGVGGGIAYRTASNVNGPWSATSTILSISGMDSFEPWHMCARTENNGVVRFTVHATPTGNPDNGHIWSAESAGVGQPIVGVQKLLEPTAGWDGNLYHGTAVPKSNLGEYWLIYSASSANVWRAGLTSFQGEIPTYRSTAPTTNTCIPNVNDSKLYEVRIRAKNQSGEGPWSAWTSVGETQGTPSDVSFSWPVFSVSVSQQPDSINFDSTVSAQWPSLSISGTQSATVPEYASTAAITWPSFTVQASQGAQVPDVDSAVNITWPALSVTASQASTLPAYDSSVAFAWPSLSISANQSQQLPEGATTVNVTWPIFQVNINQNFQEDQPVTPPSLFLFGGDVFLEFGIEYVELGFQALDGVDGDITGSVISSGTVDSQSPGRYRIDYAVTNSNNLTTTASRFVTVRNQHGQQDGFLYARRFPWQKRI